MRPKIRAIFFIRSTTTHSAEHCSRWAQLKKATVRQLADEAGLKNARKKDSTGICFIGERRFRDFLRQYLPAKPGPIQSLDGAVLGEHEGLMYHTIGQRQGLRIGGLANRPEAAWYVVDKRVPDNTLIVAQATSTPRSSGKL